MRPVGCILVASLLSWGVVAQEPGNSKCWVSCQKFLASDCQNSSKWTDKRCICTEPIRQCVQTACSDNQNVLGPYSKSCPNNPTRPDPSSMLSTFTTRPSSTSVPPTSSVNDPVSPPLPANSSPVFSSSLTSPSSSTSVSILTTTDSDGIPRTSLNSLTTIVAVVSGTSSATTVLLTLPSDVSSSAPIDAPAPSNPTNNLSADTEKQNKSNAGAIAGGIIGGLAALAILMGFVHWARRGDSSGYERDFDEKVEEPPLVQEQAEPPPPPTQRQSISSDISYV